MSTKTIRRSLVAALFVIAMCAVAIAQESRGSITGRVLDPNGAVVAGATVTVQNLATSVSDTTTTNQEGSYSFPLLKPGKYAITIAGTGFKTARREDIELAVAGKLTLDFQMEVGSASETVTVTSEAGTLETGSVSAGSTISNKQISELPLIDGSPYQLATLAPGIVYTGNPLFTSPTSNSNLASFRVNGATGPNQITLDGSPNFAIDGAVGYSPPSDATQEFKVQTSVFDAQQGYTANATVNVAIKSGTNDFHGSLYYFNRDRGRTAANFFSNRSAQPKPERTYHRYGGTLGGPVWLPGIYKGQDRTFFLFAYERLKSSDAEPQLFTVPTEAYRRGDFSALLNLTPFPTRIYDPASSCHTPSTCAVTRTAFTNNIIPNGSLNPVAVAYLKLFPLPNITGNADGTSNYFSNMIRRQNYRSWITRIDHRISDTQNIFGKYYHSFNPEDRYNWTNSPLTEGFEFRTNDGASLDYTNALSNTLVLDIRSSLSRFVQERQPGAAFDPSQLGFTSVALAGMNGYQYVPRFDIRTYDQTRPVRSTLGSNRSDYNEGLLRPFYTFAVQPMITQIHGNNTFKYGYDYRVLRENFTTNSYQGGRYFFDGTYTSIDTTTTTNSSSATNANRNRNSYGRDLAAFLLGIPTASTSQSLIDTTGINYSAQSQYHGVFFHDDWRIMPKLTLNLGLRYELELGLTERYNRFVRGFDTTTPSPVQAAAQAAYTTAYNANPANFLLAPADFKVLGGLVSADANNRALWEPDKDTLQPRIGASYQLNDRTVLRGGWGVFMAPFRVIPADMIQTGFNAQTPFIPTNDQGRNFVATLNNPFPSGFTPAFGSSLGLLTSFGQSLSASDAGIVPSNRKNAKFSRIILGIQHELPGQIVVEANYVSSWGYDMSVVRNLDFVPRQYMADMTGVTDLATATARDAAANTNLSATITNPFRNLLNGTAAASSPFNTASTISRAQSLLRFPQFANVWVQEYNGTNRYNSLQFQAAKRFSKGFSFNATYTYSRLRERLGYLNPSDTELEDRIGTEDRPNRFTFATTYELPIGRGRWLGHDMNRFADYIIGGWQFNGTYEWQQGQPILWSTPIFYAGDITQLESHAGQRDGNGNKYGVLPIPAFNTAGFLALSSSSLRTVPTTLDNLRHMPFTSVQLSLAKNFRIGETKRIQVRAEALNALNHPYFIDLSSDPSNGSFGIFSTQRNLPRDIQIGAKFVF
jgi:hypothetical protein